MSSPTAFQINHTAVLTLWAATVAERLGFDYNEALTVGRAVAGLNAHANGQRLGIFKPSRERLQELRDEQHQEGFHVALLGREVHVMVTLDGIRATAKGKPTNPASVERYLAGKFGEHLAATEKAMAELALRYPPDNLAVLAFRLYERFRPDVPQGIEGWGAEGVLDLDAIRRARQAN